MCKNACQCHTQEFKDKAAGLPKLGKPVAEVAHELEVSTSMLYEWRHKAQGTQGGSAGLRAAGEQSEADALSALRRQVARLQTENGILKKAAIILGVKTPGNCAS